MEWCGRSRMIEQQNELYDCIQAPTDQIELNYATSLVYAVLSIDPQNAETIEVVNFYIIQGKPTLINHSLVNFIESLYTRDADSIFKR